MSDIYFPQMNQFDSNKSKIAKKTAHIELLTFQANVAVSLTASPTAPRPKTATVEPSST